MLRPMRARLVLAAAIVLLCTAQSGTTFGGCGGGPGAAVPVPASPEPTCIDDSDCPPTACEDLRCIAGSCMVVAPLRDGDSDGFGAPPCGDDCDDTNASIGPGQSEICDGIDQDCDGTVDEAAPPAAVRRVLALAETEIHAAAFGDGMVVLETGLVDGLRATFVAFAGTSGAPVVLEVGEDPTLMDVATTDEGAVAVVHHRTAGTIEGIPMTVGPGSDPLVGAPFLIADVSGGPELVSLRAESLPVTGAGGTVGRVLGVSWRDALGAPSVWVDGFAAPITLTGDASGGAPPDLATDGTRLVIARGTIDAVFLDLVTGAELSTQTLPGTEWGMDPIASDDGRVVAVVRDAFDHALTSFTTTTATTLRPAPSTMPRGLPARIDTGPEFHVLTRFEDGSTTGLSGVWAFVIDPTTLMSVASFMRGEVSGSLGGGAPVVDFDVVVSESGAAVLSSFGFAGTAVTTFACRSGG